MKMFGCNGYPVGRFYYLMKTRSVALYTLYFWLILFGVIPLLMMLVSSFLSKDSLHLVAFPFTFENYADLFTPVFAKIFRSLIISCITTLLCLLIAYPFSYLMIKSKHQSILLLLILFLLDKLFDKNLFIDSYP